MAQTNVGRPNIREFIEELIARIKLCSEFSDGERVWSIYNLEDLDEKRQFAGFPVVGVAWEGNTPVDQSASTDSNFSAAAQAARRVQCQAVAMLEVRFSVIIGIEYSPVGQNDGTDDTKAIATDLLDAIREQVLGFKGVNTRPWQLEGEAPTGSEIEGVIWYGQLWKTTVPVLSQHR